MTSHGSLRFPHFFSALLCAVSALFPLMNPDLRAQTSATKSADVRDTSRLKTRSLTASVQWLNARWDEIGQKVAGAPIALEFSGPAAPIDLIGKLARPKTAVLSPEIPGVWRWERSDRLVFEPQGGWLPPQHYTLALDNRGFAPDCQVSLAEFYDRDQTESLACALEGESFFVDPSSPGLQRAVAIAVFSHPVALEEVTRVLQVVQMSKTPLFAEGGKPEVVADEKNPLRFWLRSPLIQITDKEDLLRFEITPGIRPLAGGNPLRHTAVAKVTVPSKLSGFYLQKARTQILASVKGEPRQVLFLESKGRALGSVLAKHAEAWRLPEPARDKDGRAVPWTNNNVTAAVLAASQRVPLQLIPDETGQPTSEIFGFRLEPMEPAALYVRVPKDTPAPGGFVTPEEFASVVFVPPFPKEAWIAGRGGVLALNGERKLNITSRGFDHLRFTLARVPESRINLLASLARGRFQSPRFWGGFGLEDIAHFSQTVQQVPRTNDHETNYSRFDFSPALQSGGVRHGLFHLSVQGVRRRTPNDGPAAPGDPDPDWIALSVPSEDRDDEEESNGRLRTGARNADARLVLITDLGLIVKSNSDGSRDLFVQSFERQAPVEGVRLSAIARNGDVLMEVVTDHDGHAVLPSLNGLQREKAPVALVARKADDLAFIAWERSERRVQTSRFDVGGIQSSDGAALNAFLFTERGIYRPGDPIQLGAIVRQRNWGGNLAGLPLEVVALNAKDEEAGRFQVKLPADGLVSLTVPTAETSPTGVWRLSLQLPSESRPRAQTREEIQEAALGQVLVRVEEFQPDRLKMNASFDSEDAPLWRSPDNLTARVELQTLFGIPAAGRRITGKMRLVPAQPDFQRWPGWTFGLPSGPNSEVREIDLGETETDENGRASFPLNLEAQLAPLLRVSLELEGFEADGGRGVLVAQNTLVSRQPYLVGYKADGDTNFIPAKGLRAIEVSAIRADAARVPAARLARVLLETRHVSVLTKQQNGTMAYVSQAIDRELESVDGSLPESGVRIELPTKNPGSFRYEWRDIRGVTLLAVPFTVVGSGNTTRDLERGSELQLSVPSKAWKPGEELEVSVRAPFAGAGLITIERDRVLASRWFKSEKAASVQRIAVPEGIDDGAYVHVTFVRGLDSPDIFTNPLSSGVAPFRVVQDHRILPVTLEAPAKVRPGERITIGYSTPRPARILIWAVDEGIHRVTGYQMPVPLSRLLAKPALEVETYQLVDLLIPEFTLLKNALATGGDGTEADPPELQAGLNPFKRKRAAPVVFWSKILESGPTRGEISYQVPDYFAGGLNILAVAVDRDAVGVARQHAIVKGPFVLTPNVPFFAAPGDEFLASVTVANQLEGAALTDKIRVNAELEGGLEFVEKPEEVVEIAPNKEVTLHFRLRTKEVLGNAAIKFSAQAGSERIEQTSTLSVRPAMPRRSVVQSGWFRTETHEVKIDHDFHAQFSKREAVVSTTPLGLARGLADYLREYPFGCSEQIISRAFPWLVLQDDASFGLEKAEAATVVETTIRQLASRQGPNGGFGYWQSESAEGFDYVSLYVLHFLTEAKAAGFRVPAPMMQAALRRIRFMADAKLSEPHRDYRGVLHYEQTRFEASMQAAAIYLLTRSEEVTTKYALQLGDRLKALVPEQLWQRDPSAAWLAATWRLLKKEDEASRLVRAHLAARANPLPLGEWRFYHESPLTEEATTLTVLCRHFPEIAGKFGYDELRPVTEMVEQGAFHTLSAAWTVLALKAYAALSRDSGVRAGIAQGGMPPKTLAEARSGMVTARLSAGIARFFLQRDSDSKLGAWYQTVETGFDRSVPTEPDSRTLEVRRELLTESEEPASFAKVGETLMVRVTVRNTGQSPQPNVALSELLPAGFDFAPGSDPHALKPGLGTLEGSDYVDVREDRALLFCGLKAGQTRTFTYSVRPTCAGAFVVPPACAESMYDRAVRAHSAAGKFTVFPRE